MSCTWKVRAALVATTLFALVTTAAEAFEIAQPVPNTDRTACVDVKGDDTAQNTPVLAYYCSGAPNEQWSLLPDGRLQGVGTANGVDMCLTQIPNNPPPNSAMAVLENCATKSFGANQWAIYPPSLTTATLINNDINGGTDHGYCLDSDGKYGAGAQIAADQCGNSVASTNWVLKDVVIEQPIPNSILNACVDVRGSATAAHTPVDAYPCTLGANERWTYVNGQLVGIGAMCLGISGSKKIELQTCNAKAMGQQWFIFNGLVSGSTGCLDTQGKFGGTQLVAGDCTSAIADQTWILR